MPNGLEFLSDLELEKHIQGMNDRELLEFTARQVYDVCNLSASNERRIVGLESHRNKVAGIAGSLGTFVGAGITAAINFFVNRG